tara:strand:+ start:287988 stop:288146 length:159 start_codon:yes stop_codon:yes gene_type:complete
MNGRKNYLKKSLKFFRIVVLLAHDNTRAIKKISRSPGSVKGVSLTYPGKQYN